VLVHLVSEVAGALGDRVARTVTMTVRTSLGESTARRVLKDPVREARALLTPARLALGAAITPGLEVEVLRVTLGGVFRPPPTQASLFEVLDRPGVRAAIERVEARYPGVIGRMRVVDADAYLPEHRFRFVPASDDPGALDGTPGAKGKRRVAGRLDAPS
jgi:hypothetical protein